MNLDLIPNGAIKRVHVSQNDIGRTLTFELFNNSTSYTIPSGAVVKIQGTKPSGFGFSETCTVSGNVVTVDTTEEMTDEYGYINTELSISYSGNKIGTSNFVLAVEKNPHPDTTTDGSMETIIPELTLLVNEVKGYAEEIEGTYHAYGSPWVASTVAEMTDTDKIYVYTGSETGYTNGNWYYYNGSAWVSGGVYNSVAVQTDTTLSVSGMPADAKVVGDVFNDFTLKKIGININNSDYEGGYINSSGGDTGSSTYATSFRSTDYIPVESGKTVVWWGYLTDNTVLGASAYLVEYDANKNYIQRNTDLKKYGSSSTGYEQQLSSTTKYIRFAMLQGVDDKSTIRIAIYYSENAQASYVGYEETKVVNYDNIYNSSLVGIDTIIDNKINGIGYTPLYDYEEITVTGESGALMSDGTIRETTDVIRYKIPVSKGDRYVVCARHGYAYRAFLVLDSDSNILSYFPTTTSGTVVHRNVQVDIGQDGYLVLQDVYQFMPILGKVARYTTGDNLYQKSIYWNGDSICYGAGGTSFADQISLFHAMPETMDAVSGTRLSTRSGATNSIYERVIAMDTTANYDFIGIEGGYNDYFSSVPIGTLTSNYSDTPDTSTVIGAVEGICQHIRSNFKNSKCFFVLGHRPIAVGAYPTDVDTYWDAIISALNKWAVPYVDIRKEGTLMAYNADWLADYFGEGETMGTHPNTLGYKMFYNDIVESKMKTI